MTDPSGSRLLALICCIILATPAISQQIHRLKYVTSGPAPSSSSMAATQLTSMSTEVELRNTKNRFVKVNKICVTGMWALYTTPDYGEGAEDSTMVVSTKGTDLYACTSPDMGPLLKYVRSARFLGNADYSQDGILIFSLPDFLGGLWYVNNPDTNSYGPSGYSSSQPPPGVTGFPLQSMAITGSSAWVVCGDNDVPCTTGVCIDMRRFDNLYYMKNSQSWDNGMPGGSDAWPKTVRRVWKVSSEECANYPGPVQPAAPKPTRAPVTKPAPENFSTTMAAATTGATTGATIGVTIVATKPNSNFSRAFDEVPGSPL